MVSIPLHIRFNEVDGFIKTYDGIRYLAWFSNSWYDKICNRIGKKGITYKINHNFAKFRFDLYNPLPTEKILTFHNVIILIKSVVKENKSNCYYNILLEKGLYRDKSNTQYL